MKKRMATIALGILMLASGMAVEIYAGESHTFSLDKEYEYFSVVGNTTPVLDNITQNGLNITITINKYVDNQTFSIVFFDREDKIIPPKIIYRGGGGGSSRTEYVDRIILEPKFYDRNITEIINKEIPVEKIIYQKNEYNFWVILLLALSMGAWVVWIIYQLIMKSNNNSYNIEEELNDNPNNNSSDSNRNNLQTIEG